MSNGLDFNQQQGQTIVEAVVAIAIIVLALLGFVALASGNARVSAESGDRLLAVNLAREGVEAVRAIRDSNWLYGCPNPPADCVYWDSRINGLANDYTARLDFDSAAGEFDIDYAPDNLENCVADESCRLFIQDNGVYNHQSSAARASRFHRLITMQPVCANAMDCGGDGLCDDGQACASEKIGIKITSHVRWFFQGQAHNVMLEDYLYNWR